MRLFFAIEVPEQVKAKILTAQQRLAEQLPVKGFRLTKSDMLHITLAFIGEVERSNLSEVRSAAEQLCAQTPATRLDFEGLGCFPSWKHPRVLWIGVQEEGHEPFSQQAPMALLGRSLTNAFAHLSDHQAEERVLLHVTLARTSTRTKKEEMIELGELAAAEHWTDFGETIAESVVLYESTAGESGPVTHFPLARFQLKG